MTTPAEGHNKEQGARTDESAAANSKPEEGGASSSKSPQVRAGDAPPELNRLPVQRGATEEGPEGPASRPQALKRRPDPESGSPSETESIWKSTAEEGQPGSSAGKHEELGLDAGPGQREQSSVMAEKEKEVKRLSLR